MNDLLTAFESIFGPQAWGEHTWSEPADPPDVDLFVSESEAAYRQRAVDARLGEMWGAA